VLFRAEHFAALSALRDDEGARNDGRTLPHNQQSQDLQIRASFGAPLPLFYPDDLKPAVSKENQHLALTQANIMPDNRAMPAVVAA
jgi:hypothetical protein